MNAPVPPVNEPETLKQQNQYQASYNQSFSNQPHQVEQSDLQQEQLQTGKLILEKIKMLRVSVDQIIKAVKSKEIQQSLSYVLTYTWSCKAALHWAMSDFCYFILHPNILSWFEY